MNSILTASAMVMMHTGPALASRSPPLPTMTERELCQVAQHVVVGSVLPGATATRTERGPTRTKLTVGVEREVFSVDEHAPPSGATELVLNVPLDWTDNGGSQTRALPNWNWERGTRHLLILRERPGSPTHEPFWEISFHRNLPDEGEAPPLEVLQYQWGNHCHEHRDDVVRLEPGWLTWWYTDHFERHVR